MRIGSAKVAGLPGAVRGGLFGWLTPQAVEPGEGGRGLGEEARGVAAVEEDGFEKAEVSGMGGVGQADDGQAMGAQIADLGQHQGQVIELEDREAQVGLANVGEEVDPPDASGGGQGFGGGMPDVLEGHGPFQQDLDGLVFREGLDLVRQRCPFRFAGRRRRPPPPLMRAHCTTGAGGAFQNGGGPGAGGRDDGASRHPEGCATGLHAKGLYGGA